MKKVIDLTGQVFGRLTVIDQAGKNKFNKILWKCQCCCESRNIVIKIGNSLKMRHTNSCGCIKIPPKIESNEKYKLKLLENSYRDGDCLIWKGPFRQNFPHGVVSCKMN